MNVVKHTGSNPEAQISFHNLVFGAFLMPFQAEFADQIFGNSPFLGSLTPNPEHKLLRNY